ncbi:MAG: O-antigen ligase family protein [Brevundimonas sp.]
MSARTEELLGRCSVAAFLATTLVLVPGGLHRWALPKLLVLAAGVLVAALTAARGRLPRAVSALVVAGLGILLVAGLAADAPLAQLVGRWPRYEGVVVIAGYGAAAWAGARLLGPAADERRLRWAGAATAVASIVLGIVSALEATGLRPLGGDVSRPGALLGNASDQGAAGLLLLALLVVPAVRRPNALLVSGAIGAGVTVVVSGSRGAVLGALLALAVVVAVELVRAPTPQARVRAAALPAGAAAALAVAALAVPATRARLLGADELATATVSGRRDLWGSTASLVAHHPLLGVGPGGFVDALPQFRSAAWTATSDPRSVADSPHSWPLQAAAAGGLPMLVVALTLAAAVLVIGVRRVRAQPPGPRSDLLAGALAAACGYGVALLTHFTGPGTTPLAAFACGALVSAAPHGPARRAIGALVPAAVVLAVLVPAVVAEPVLAAAVRDAAGGNVTQADARFHLASTLRPWDRDVALVASTTFDAGSRAGDAASAEAALRWAQRSLRAAPTSTEAARAAATARLTLEQPQAALDLLDAPLTLDPADASLLLLRGLALAQLGRLDEAVGPLVAATHNAPTAPTAWRLLARVYEAQGDLERRDDALARSGSP